MRGNAFQLLLAAHKLFNSLKQKFILKLNVLHSSTEHYQISSWYSLHHQSYVLCYTGSHQTSVQPHCTENQIVSLPLSHNRTFQKSPNRSLIACILILHLSSNRDIFKKHMKSNNFSDGLCWNLFSNRVYQCTPMIRIVKIKYNNSW